MVRLKVLDLFCGCGGFSLGFESAGFKIVMGIDNWEVACESYQTNFPSAEVLCEDIMNIDPSTLPRVDIIIGSPPCQDFSCANLKKKEDPTLINKFWKIVDELQPKWIIMEEVPAAKNYIPNGWMKRIYKMCDYGVPQIRRRLFAGRFVDPPKCPTKAMFPAVMATEYRGVGGTRQRTRLSDIFGRKSLIPEAKLVQTFPLDYYLAGTLKDQYIQIGNAVPPVMAYHLAMAIKEPKQVFVEVYEYEV